MKSARWTKEQLAEHLQRTGGNVLWLPAKDRSAVSVPGGLKLSNDRIDGVAEYLFQIQAAGLEMPEFEFSFHDDRRWRADFAWPDRMLLAEYEGGIYTKGAHVRGKHFESDCEKYNEATLLGYRVLRFTHRMVHDGMALEMTERALRP